MSHAPRTAISALRSSDERSPAAALLLALLRTECTAALAGFVPVLLNRHPHAVVPAA